MLALPLNFPDDVTSGSAAPLSQQISQFLDSQSSTFPPEQLGQLRQDASILEQCREDSIRLTEPTDANIQQLLRYHQALEAVVPRLDGYESELKVNFPWIDGFNRKRKISSSSFYFEWAVVTWNLASLESIRGSRIDRTSDDGIKQANKAFSNAAGYVDFIKDRISSHIRGGSISPLSAEGLELASQLMLAQAQLCFYEKGVRDKKAGSATLKAAIIAKLAQQVSVFFAKAAKACTSETLHTILDSSWTAHTDFQCKCFAGAAEYWQAIASKEAAQAAGSGHGEEITRLCRSEKFLQQALNVAQRVDNAPALSAGAEVMIRTVQTAKAAAERDNSTVYLEVVPQDHSLASVTPVAMVKPTPITEFTSTNAESRKLFKDLMPKSVRITSNSIKERMDGIFRAVSTEANNATSMVRGLLNSMGLPGSLEAFKAGGEFPESIWNKIQKTQSMGGIKSLESKLDEIEAAAQRALSAMSNIDSAADLEEKNDEQFRSRFPTWRGTPSVDLNRDIRANVLLLRETYQTARQSDISISATVRDPSFQTVSQQLLLSKEELTKLLPVQPPSLIDMDDFSMVLPAGNSDANVLEQKLLAMADLITEREALVEKLKDFATGKDIAGSLSLKLSSGVDITASAVSDAYIAHCDEISNKISALQEAQTRLLDEVSVANQAFQKSRATDPVTKAREDIIQKLEQGVSQTFNLSSQLNAGITFYSNMQSRLSTVLQSCNDLTYSQTTLRQEFECNLMSEFERSSQENRDLEYAKKLAAEMEAIDLQASAPPPQPSLTQTSGGTPQGDSVNPPNTASPLAAPQYVPSYSMPSSQPPPYGAYAPSIVPSAGSNSALSSPPPHLHPHHPHPSHQSTPPPLPASGALNQYPAVAAQTHSHYTPASPLTGSITYGQPVAGPPPSFSASSPYAATHGVHNPPQAPATYTQYNQQPPPYNPNFAPSAPYGQQGQPQPYQQQQLQQQQYHQQHMPPQPPQQQQPQPYLPYQQYQQQQPQHQHQHQQQPYPSSAHTQQPPPQLPAQGQQQQVQVHPEVLTKAHTLSEMGFPLDKCIHALQVNGNNEEAALNSLLSGDVATAPSPALAPSAASATGTANAEAPNKPPKPSGAGLFGKIWGKG